ncbi:hypothetical protein QYF61_018578 [Mycteria americana]|uniref:Uncharacterized protein n=1 Tax=Mycteria americana TaxID=33587 RepID=A0AAN7PUK0_MYCAM|nr:hypothetical protein QYF61_018578 [Mycteria americana]
MRSADPTSFGLKKTVNKVHDFQEDEELFRCCTLPEVKSQQGDGGNLSCLHPMHQDLHYFLFWPVDRIMCF